MAFVVNRPADPQQILRNLSVLLQTDSLISEQFYSEKAIGGAFGGSGVRWNDNSRSQKRGDVLYDSSPVLGFGLYFTWQDQDGTTSATISFYRHVEDNGGLTFEKVEELFGPDWQLYSPSFVPVPSSVVNAPKHRMGNRKVVYERKGEKSTKTIVITFDHNGAYLRSELTARAN